MINVPANQIYTVRHYWKQFEKANEKCDGVREVGMIEFYERLNEMLGKRIKE